MSTVFVTGATGVLGRATIPQLLAAGYSVRALSRTEANDATIHALGAEPVRGDLFDQRSLREAMTGVNGVLHLATRIPPSSEMRRRSAWAENDRIRAQGTKNLVDAALAADVHVFVYPSFAFVYPESGDSWIDAALTPVDPIDILRFYHLRRARGCALHGSRTLVANGAEFRCVWADSMGAISLRPSSSCNSLNGVFPSLAPHLRHSRRCSGSTMPPRRW